jgi:hypothetical protein
MQRVQTFSRFGEPFTRARTGWMLGFQRRFVRIWECETLFPNPGPRPQTSQVAAMSPRMIAATPSPDNQNPARTPEPARIVAVVG